MSTDPKNHNSKLIFSFFFKFWIILTFFKKNTEIFIFGRGSKNCYSGVGGMSGNDMWKFDQNHWIFTPSNDLN